MNKLSFILFVLVLALFACGENKTQENTTNENTGYYGEKITEDGAVEIPAFLALLENKDSVKVKLKAKINECCQKKGCWMTVDIGNGKEMMVRFKDYSFFVPMNAGGMNTVIDGWAYVDTISVEEQKHYLEDENASKAEIEKITDPKIEWTFLASGVIIKNENQDNKK